MANLFARRDPAFQKRALGQIRKHPCLLTKFCFGLLYGTCLGTIDFYFEKVTLVKSLWEADPDTDRLFFRRSAPALLPENYSISSFQITFLC